MEAEEGREREERRRRLGERLTGRERKRGTELNGDGDIIYLGFIKSQRYNVFFFFFFNLIPKRTHFETNIKIKIKLKQRCFGIVELKFKNPTFPIW